MNGVAYSKRGDEGFTMAEVVISIGILFFALTAIIGFMLSSIQASASASARVTMTNAANSYIERLRAMPYDSIVSATATSTAFTANGYTVTITPTSSLVDDPKTAAVGDYRKVVLNIQGSAPGRPTLAMNTEAIIRPQDQATGEKPKIEFSANSPASGATVSGNSVTVGAIATGVGPGVTISTMNFYIGGDSKSGTPIHSTTGVAQWSMSESPSTRSINWDTTLLNEDGKKRSPDGYHTIRVEAWDSNQRIAFKTRRVLVDNTAPLPVTDLVASPVNATSMSLNWTPTVDGNEPTYTYRFSSVRRQGPTHTSTTGTTDWDIAIPLAIPGSLQPAPPKTFATSALSRYRYRIRSRSPGGIESTPMDAIAVSRPSMSGDFTNVKSGSDVDVTASLHVGGPTFPVSSSSAKLLFSTSASMTNPIEYTMVWNATDKKWSYTDLLESKKRSVVPYYYQAVVTVTPSGYLGGTAQTLKSQVLKLDWPAYAASNVSASMPTAGW